MQTDRDVALIDFILEPARCIAYARHATPLAPLHHIQIIHRTIDNIWRAA
jgi:hypothetical protein